MELEEGTADVCEELVLDGAEVDDTAEVLELDTRLEEEGIADELSVLFIELATDVSIEECELED